MMEFFPTLIWAAVASLCQNLLTCCTHSGRAFVLRNYFSVSGLSFSQYSFMQSSHGPFMQSLHVLFHAILSWRRRCCCWCGACAGNIGLPKVFDGLFRTL